MANRFFYVTNSTPGGSPPTARQSSAMPGASTLVNRNLGTYTLVASGASPPAHGSWNSLAQTGRQATYHYRAVLPDLAAQTIAAQNWQIAHPAVEGNGAANVFTCASIFVWRPGSSSVVGFIYDSQTEVGSEWSTTGGSISTVTISGAAVSGVQAGDMLVWEVWCTAAQSMATAYSNIANPQVSAPNIWGDLALTTDPTTVEVSIAATVPMQQLAATLGYSDTVQFAATIPMQQLAAAVDVQPPGFDVGFTATIPMQQLAAAVDVHVEAQFAGVIPMQQLAAAVDFTAGGGGTPALVSSVTIDGGEHGGVTSSAIDTTGATLIVVKVAWRDTATPAPTDNKGNTYTALTQYDSDAGSSSGRLYYAANPTVGTGHTFTLPTTSNSWCSAVVAAFSGVATSSPFDVENGNGTKATGTTILPGSITPSQANSLVMSGLQHVNGDLSGYPITIGSSFTKIAETGTVVAVQRGAALAYKVQTSAVAENPTWTDPWSSARMVATIASFKPGGAPPAPEITFAANVPMQQLAATIDVPGPAPEIGFAGVIPMQQLAATVNAGNALIPGTPTEAPDPPALPTIPAYSEAGFTTKTIKPGGGGDFTSWQAAVDAWILVDQDWLVVADAGVANAVTEGMLRLKANPNTSRRFYGVSANRANLPAVGSGIRVTPSDAPDLAWIYGTDNRSVLSTVVGSGKVQNYRFYGIAIKPASTFGKATGSPVYATTNIGSDASLDTYDTTYAACPAKIGFEQCLWTANDPVGLSDTTTANWQIVRHVQLSSFDECWFRGCHLEKAHSTDYQAIAILMLGGRKLLIQDTYLEASGENFFIGGASYPSAELFPTDFTLDRVYFFKPAAWNRWSASYMGDFTVTSVPRYASRHSLELKMGIRGEIKNFVMDRQWAGGGEQGWHIVLMSTNQNNDAPLSQVAHINIHHGKILHSTAICNIIGKYGTYVEQPTHHIWIHDIATYEINHPEVDDPGFNYGQVRGFRVNNGAYPVHDLCIERITHNQFGGEGGYGYILSAYPHATDKSLRLTVRDIVASGRFSFWSDNALSGQNAIAELAGTNRWNPAIPSQFPNGWHVVGTVAIDRLEAEYGIGGGAGAGNPTGNTLIQGTTVVLADVYVAPNPQAHPGGGTWVPRTADLRIKNTSPAFTAAEDGGPSGADIDDIEGAVDGVVEGVPGDTVQATFAATVPMQQLAATVDTGFAVTFAATVPMQQLAATVNVVAPFFDVHLTASVPMQQLAAAVDVTLPGASVQFAGVIPMQQLAATLNYSVTPATVTFAASLPMQQLAATLNYSVTPATVTFAATIPMQQLAAAVNVAGGTITASFAATLPMQTLAVTLDFTAFGGWVVHHTPVTSTLPTYTGEGAVAPTYTPIVHDARLEEE